MGLLTEGSPLQWEDAERLASHVRENGLEQLLYLYNALKDRQNDCLKWGEEVEYMIVRRREHEVDADQGEGTRTVRLGLVADQLLPTLYEDEHQDHPVGLWRPEYANYMLEGTPGIPYGSRLVDLVGVEASMEARRARAQELLPPHHTVLSLSMFPLIGADHTYCTHPPAPPGGPITQSCFVPDSIINPHPRFGTLTANIRQRRHKKVAIFTPLYRDQNTDIRVGLGEDGERVAQAEGHRVEDGLIYTDAMAFGMGCCCLQSTFQACNLNEARLLYDQLLVVCPLLLALSASTPIVRGILSDHDVRWPIIGASVDDRRDEEKPYIRKSRYASSSVYIQGTEEAREMSDLRVYRNEDAYRKLRNAGLDEDLSHHFAHLFIRDPLVIFADRVDLDNAANSDHFENIQSTNWQTVRFKPPPPNSSIGWRVEFRVLEVQLTDFENAAFIVFVVLLTRTLLSFRLNMRTPISLVDDNMERSFWRDAATEGRFHFRTRITPKDQAQENGEPEFREMSMNEIFNGSEEFIGLVPLVEQYLDSVHVDVETRMQLDRYLALIRRRASGDLKTTARYMRDFVRNHPKYRKDSVVSDEIAYDLVELSERITNGQEKPTELLGDLTT
eukprot:gb/GECH01000677.1/.p1 GENE.gb/GECH01000677.1/~~gb/GECH01000677.1/.p1  ORF type:complete len:615 (+),score=87.57 gb/GECH01000677.1/:1-1845(+)